MANAALGFLLQTLRYLAEREASLFRGLKIEEIQLELESMLSFLKVADRRKIREMDDDGVQTWVGQVREITYKVEDVIDKYMYHVAELQLQADGGLLQRTLSKTLLLPKRYSHNRKIASELQTIKSEIHEISERYKRYCLLEEGSTSNTNDDGGGENWQHLRQQARLIPDVDIVGIEESKNFLIKRLTESDQVPERVVLPVVGMGGLGKTTLVTKVYNHSKVKSHFDCHAWITISQTYKVDELLRNLMKELCKSTNEPIPNGVAEMDTIEISEMLISYLQTKRYVIVLDDVWNAIAWQHIQLALPDNGCGGRVMITTRMDDFASSFGVGNVLRLGHLGNDDAFVLFCSKAFSNKSCPLHLKPYAERLVQKCEGLPLAIVTIGGLMAMKEKSSLEWSMVEASLSWQLGNNKDLGGLKNILLLSFNDLPYNLKYCFLYCSLFPEDCLITQKRLIRLWVAQGFIQERRGLTLEEVAADYIKDLVCRGMLQYAESALRFKKKVRMHDVLRELAISIGQEENFCYINDGKEETLNKKARYLSMCRSVVNIGPSNCHLRSLMLFKTEITSLSLRGILSSFKLLRVLDLEDSPIKSLPDELVELFNLRYLSLRNTNVEELPESIGRLQNLQTLDIRGSKINILPRGVKKLKKLRHIYTYRRHQSLLTGNFSHYKFAQAPDGICNLKCLQTLERIGANNEIVKEIGNLTQLRKLTIEKVERNHGVELCASLRKMEGLRLLNVISTREEEILNIEALSSPPTHLETLILHGRLERLPLWIVSLQNLTSVALHWSQLNEDPLSSLQALPNLMILYLTEAYVGKELCFRCRHFLQLKELCIAQLAQLNKIKFEEESMSCIHLLFLFDCPNLKNVEGTQYLTSLQLLFLKEVSGELLGKIRGDEWVDFQHIPQLLNFNSTKGAYERLHQVFHTQVPSGAQDYQGGRRKGR
ncbi:disease resistance protein RPM1-like protein [Cinnamomum micranthum f. kanehirae]|uniref:Disease resistance protein RPM1-like protein n=1 Tax=Cinnamomum micranthum f. kanehirae TaxID=337451 RepID=A0A443PAU8_9MAGN|nr:disease resistance protein RPM1-like protein [Cinnamomum micranthum f. kanehirae]